MRPTLRHGAFVLAFFAGVAWAFGVQLARSGTGGETDASWGDEPQTVGAPSAGLIVSARRDAFEPLTDEERAHVFDGVMRTVGVPVADVEPPESTAALPLWVALQELPSAVVRQIPRVHGYKFVKLDDRILLVHPASRRVVAEMPRYKLMLQ